MSNSSIWSKIGPYQVLSLRASVNLDAVAMNEYSVFPKRYSNNEDSQSDCVVSYQGVV